MNKKPKKWYETSSTCEEVVQEFINLLYDGGGRIIQGEYA